MAKVKSAHWFTGGRALWFIHGNLSLKSALEIAEKGRNLLTGNVNPVPVSKKDLIHIKPLQLSEGSWNKIEQPLDDK
jgi:hypothetical protein